MKVVLLVLTGGASWVRKELSERYPGAIKEEISRVDIESEGLIQRLARCRARMPDLFVVATERLAWQRGQESLMLFAALAGAKRIVFLDAHGHTREENRLTTLLRSPLRLARDAFLSGSAIARTKRLLKKLERTVAKREWLVLKQPREDQEVQPPGSITIAYLRATPSAGTQVGGASSHINGFINAALEKGANVTVVSNDRIAGLDEDRVAVKVIEPKLFGITRPAFDLHNNLLFTLGALREVQANPPDLIYQRYGRFGWAGVEISIRTGRPLFLEYNGSEVWIAQHWDRTGMLSLLERFERLNLRAAAKIIVVSEVERDNLLETGIEEDKIIVNLNAVDADRFKPNIGGEEIREELGIGKEEVVVGFAGTFGPWHGVLTLAETIASMPADAPIRFLLVGEGSLRGEVERILRNAGAEERAIFTGAVAHERVPALLDACNVLVSPHIQLEDGRRFFGSPTKLFEYMAMGKCIIASRLGQIADVLEDEKTALLVSPGDREELRAAIVGVAASREMRERLGAAARRKAIANHTWARNAERVLDGYNSWMAEMQRKA